jgi:hypothetical protein
MRVQVSYTDEEGGERSLRAIPAGWLSHAAPAAAQGTHELTLRVRGHAAVCRAPAGCAVRLSEGATPRVHNCTLDGRAARPNGALLPMACGARLTCNGSGLDYSHARLHQTTHPTHDPTLVFAGSTPVCAAQAATDGRSLTCTIGALPAKPRVPGSTASSPLELRVWTSGAGWAAADGRLHTTLAPDGPACRGFHAPRAAAGPTGLPGLPSRLASSPSRELHSPRPARALQEGERLLSEVIADGACNHPEADCIIPAGESWLFNWDLDVRGQPSALRPNPCYLN